jgi:acyl carrier protein
MIVKEQIRKFILSNYLFTDDMQALSDQHSLMESGTMDSTGVLELITYLEATYDIKVEDEEMIPANLDSVNAIAAYVERKKDN